MQDLEIFPLFQSNLNRNEESTHVLHVLHIAGHILDTPSALHLIKVSLFATHAQDLEIFPLFQSNLNRNNESVQSDGPLGEDMGEGVLNAGDGGGVWFFVGESVVRDVDGDCVSISNVVGDWVGG